MFIFIIVLTGLCLALGYWAGWHDGTRMDRTSGVTPSCGCIMCDLKLPIHRAPLSGATYHKTQGGIVLCDRSS